MALIQNYLMSVQLILKILYRSERRNALWQKTGKRVEEAVKAVQVTIGGGKDQEFLTLI